MDGSPDDEPSGCCPGPGPCCDDHGAELHAQEKAGIDAILAIVTARLGLAETDAPPWGKRPRLVSDGEQDGPSG